jgi:hypothetical protein
MVILLPGPATLHLARVNGDMGIRAAGRQPVTQACPAGDPSLQGQGRKSRSRDVADVIR